MNFLNPYSRIDYKDFFQNKLLTDEFEFIEEKLSLEFKPQYLKQVELLGRDKSLELDVYEILHASENDPRVGLSKEIFRLMSKYGSKRALAILYSLNSNNYRLSLATVELSLEGSKIKREYSNPRRYSFFLGPDSKIHTPSEFLISKGRVSNFEDLQNRFSIEVVNKEFYQRIAVQFSKLVGGTRKIGAHNEDYRRTLLLPSVTEQHIFQEFAVRLIGRLVFCWFLKMKKSDNNIPLIPSEVLSLESSKTQSNFYHNVLEKLFFEVLNTPIDERRKEFRQTPFIDIPFLNGGLFNPHNEDFYEPDRSGVTKYLNTLKVPDKWLQDFIEILETYNFTVDENTSVDVDLSVDPEMLGRIFENLLAEINPETGESARKATGSFYTPRPIVEYMVDESLKQYLITETAIEEHRIINLLSYSDGEIDLSDKEKEKIIDVFDKVKILDPACGSGAFPIGILQKMLLVLKRVDPKSKMWLNKQLERVPTSALKNKLRKKLEDENVEYIHKLGIIQNSIYGIDLQPIASEISKLRCFLSLIVDEKVYDDILNRGILPLPNLEFKFVAANTLIPLPKSKSQSELFNVDEDIQKLEELRTQYFTASGKEKVIIESEFLRTQKDLVSNYFIKQAKDDRAIKLGNWNPFSDEPSTWFDPEWMFGLTEGFHIVIGNPPYVTLQSLKNNKSYNNYINNGYKTFDQSGDVYCLFYERSNQLLIKQGVLCLITSNKWMRTLYGSKLRNYFISNMQIIHLIDFFGFRVFENVIVDTNILLAQKLVYKNEKINVCIIKDDYDSSTSLINYIIKNIFIYQIPANEWSLASNEFTKILSKINLKGRPLNSFNCKILYGLKTGYNAAYLINQTQYNTFKKSNSQNISIIKPVLLGRTLSNYAKSNKINDFLINTHNGIKEINIPSINTEKDYPDIYKHLSMYKKELIKRTDQGNHWSNLRDCAYLNEFENKKIAFPVINRKWTFTLVDEGIYILAPARFIVCGNDDLLLFLYYILSSSILKFYFSFIGIIQDSGGFQMDTRVVGQLPIPPFEKRFISLFKNCSTDRRDLIVSKLFNLDFNEMIMVLPNLEKIISEKDYEKMEI